MSKKHTIQADKIRKIAPKKPYHMPHLIEYGHIAELTAGSTGSCTDKGHMANMHGQG